MKYRPIPTSLHGALEADKDEGIHRRRMSVERIAEAYGNRPKTVYDWIEEASIPASKLALWFEKTGGKNAIRFLCAQAGGLFIELPTGRPTTSHGINELQTVLTQSVRALLDFQEGKLGKDECGAALMAGLEGLAYERQQVLRADQPELEFGK